MSGSSLISSLLYQYGPFWLQNNKHGSGQNLKIEASSNVKTKVNDGRVHLQFVVTDGHGHCNVTRFICACEILKRRRRRMPLFVINPVLAPVLVQSCRKVHT